MMVSPAQHHHKAFQNRISEERQKQFASRHYDRKEKLQSTQGGLAYDKAPPQKQEDERQAARFPSCPDKYMAGSHIWASRALVLSRREFVEEMKFSSGVKILTDLLASMSSTFSKQDEQGDFSLHSGILKSSLQVPCWMRLDL